MENEILLDFVDTSPHKVLVVEDDSADMMIINARVNLAWPNAIVVAAKSLEEAQSICESEKFHIILLDLNLPDGSGSNTVEQLRKFNKDTPIVVVTGLTDETIERECIAYGAKLVIAKQDLIGKELEKALSEHSLSLAS